MTKRTHKRPTLAPLAPALDWPHLADEAGQIKAQIAAATAALAPLQDRLTDIRALAVAHGVREAEGEAYRLVVTTAEPTIIDADAIIADLQAMLIRKGTRQATIDRVVARHTSAGRPVHGLRVYGRKATGARAEAS